LRAITDTASGPVIMTAAAEMRDFAPPPAPPPPPIGVGEQTLRVTVTVSWEVK
jgi:uncharacterized protein YggE